jgi:hypothetical protein
MLWLAKTIGEYKNPKQKLDKVLKRLILSSFSTTNQRAGSELRGEDNERK